MVLEPKAGQSEDSDGRYFPRWRIDKRLTYQLKSESMEKEARVFDLSCTGVRLVSVEPLLPTQTVDIKIYLDDRSVIDVSGRIIWVNHLPLLNHAGIHFDEINEDAQELILEHAFSVKKEDLVNYWFKGWEGKA